MSSELPPVHSRSDAPHHQERQARSGEEHHPGHSARFGKRSKLVVSGKQYTPQEVIALYESHVDAIREAETARVLFTVAVRKKQALARRTKALALQLKLTVFNEFGLAPGPWGDFGWKLPKKPGPKTAAARYQGVKTRGGPEGAGEREGVAFLPARPPARASNAVTARIPEFGPGPRLAALVGAGPRLA